jgi:hypothetical protein
MNVYNLLPFFCDLVIDRVFRSDCGTREVYEEAAKEVALSVVSGINCEFIFLILSELARMEVSFHVNIFLNLML